MPYRQPTSAMSCPTCFIAVYWYAQPAGARNSSSIYVSRRGRGQYDRMTRRFAPVSHPVPKT
eukprot:scaffold20763_cov116-Isochrysis_galbana.AAC.5